MRRSRTDRSSRARGLAAVLCGLALSCAATALRAEDVVVPGTADFPESVTATADGTLFFSSLAGGRIWRAAPGATQASEWIGRGSNGLASVLGLLADDRSGTVYACSVDMSWAGIEIPGDNKPTALKLFDLRTGALKASLPLPPSPLPGQRPLCNDIAVAADGTAYVTDSLAGHILRLRPGAPALEVWARDARWDVKGPQLDGIAVLPDGSVYANIFEGDGLYRIAVQPDGSAGTITRLQTSRPLFHADGLRAAGPNVLLMVQGEGKGTLDRITVDGDTAKVETIRAGFDTPVSLAQVGNTVYVLDAPLRYLFDPKLKGQSPKPSRAIGVTLDR